MAPVNGYCAKEDIKAAKKITTVDAADDALIDDLITAVSRYIDNETGRRFFAPVADETRVYSAANGYRLYLPDDLISVTTLKTDEDGDRTYEVTWAVTDYDLMPDNASLTPAPYTWIEVTPLGRYTFPLQNRGVQIVGRFGYGSIPADLERACIDTVIAAYDRRYGSGMNGAGSDSVTVTGAGVVITPRDVPESAWKTIKQYRRFS